MRRAVVPNVWVGHIRLPEDLAKDLADLLRDPLTGKARYGALQALTIQLFSNWIDSQRERSALADPPSLPPIPTPAE